jgi:hypothetical protein
MTSLNELPQTAEPTEAPRPNRAGSGGIRWLAGAATAIGGAVVTALGTVVTHQWYLPFAIGLVLGALTTVRRTRPRVIVAFVAIAATGGWGLALLWRALTGEPVAAAAQVTAALAGLPPNATIIITATLLVALLQGLCGAWIGLAIAALIPRRAEPTEPGKAP